MPGQVNLQIGKQGLTEGILNCIKLGFQKHETLKVVVLKNAGHDKEKVENIMNKILQELGKKYTARVIGFTINIKKWRKARS